MPNKKLSGVWFEFRCLFEEGEAAAAAAVAARRYACVLRDRPAGRQTEMLILGGARLQQPACPAAPAARPHHPCSAAPANQQQPDFLPPVRCFEGAPSFTGADAAAPPPVAPDALGTKGPASTPAVAAAADDPATGCGLGFCFR